MEKLSKYSIHGIPLDLIAVMLLFGTLLVFILFLAKKSR
jgi:hypothetical protein